MNRRENQRSLRATQRFSAFLVALLWCVAPVLASLHATSEVHRYCAEHGAVEEAAAPSGANTESDGSHAHGSDEGTSHEDCAFAKVCRFGQTLVSFVFSATGSLQSAPMLLPRTGASPRLVALIRLAPKTSPPV